MSYARVAASPPPLVSPAKGSSADSPDPVAGNRSISSSPAKKATKATAASSVKTTKSPAATGVVATTPTKKKVTLTLGKPTSSQSVQPPAAHTNNTSATPKATKPAAQRAGAVQGSSVSTPKKDASSALSSNEATTVKSPPKPTPKKKVPPTKANTVPATKHSMPAAGEAKTRPAKQTPQKNVPPPRAAPVAAQSDVSLSRESPISAPAPRPSPKKHADKTKLDAAAIGAAAHSTPRKPALKKPDPAQSSPGAILPPLVSTSPVTPTPKPRPTKEVVPGNVEASDNAIAVGSPSATTNRKTPKIVKKFKPGNVTVEVTVDDNDEAMYVSSESDPAVPVPDRKDSAYRGRGSKNRIVAGQESIIRTRSARAKEASLPAATVDDSDVELVEGPSLPVTPKKKKATGKKVFKSNEFIASDSDAPAPPTSPPPSTPKRRRVQQAVESDSNSEAESVVVARNRRLKRRRDESPEPLPAHDDDMDVYEGKNLDEYDVDDGFIDDAGAEVSGEDDSDMDVDAEGESTLPADAEPNEVDLEEDEVGGESAVEDEEEDRRDPEGEASVASVNLSGAEDEGVEDQYAGEQDDEYIDDEQQYEEEQDDGEQYDGDEGHAEEEQDVEEGEVNAGADAGYGVVGDDDDDLSFGDLISKGVVAVNEDETADGHKDEVFLSDLEYIEVTNRPTEDEVMDRSLQDPLLVAFYTHLIAVRKGLFKSWSDLLSRVGMIRFSSWAKTIPHLKIGKCLSAINLSRYGQHVNMARCTFDDIRIHKAPGGRQRYLFYTSDLTPAICVSSVMCTESHVLRPPNAGMKQKWFYGVFHTQEYERTVGFICTAVGMPVLGAQIFKNQVQFATRSFWKSNHEQDTAVQGNGSTDLSVMFSDIQSPAAGTSSGSTSTVTSDRYALDWDATIPVYDARRTALKFPEILDDLSLLPRWVEEIPNGSFVVAGHTVSVFYSNSTKGRKAGWYVSFNIQWAIILGIPGSP